MLNQAQDGRVIHMPKNPDVFQFDDEVAKIFPDMARRSIPMYHEAHRAHAAMLAPWLQFRDVDVLDIGASRGEFFRYVETMYPEHIRGKDVRYTAIDNSQAMLNMLSRDFPNAYCRKMDLLSDDFLCLDRQYDIIVCNYIIQFIPPEHQWRILTKIAQLVRPGGVLVFGHKAASSGMMGKVAHDEYIEFRIRNGYSRAEIEAKTKALANAMWTQDHEELKTGLLGLGFTEIVETTRWMMFNTFVAMKGV